MKPYSSARDEFKKVSTDLVFLDANENPFNNGVNRYPDPQQSALKEKLSEIKGVPVDQILLGNGSDEVLDLIFRAFCEPNVDSIITLPPTYGMYEVLANLNANTIKSVVLDNNFEPNVDEILKTQDNSTKLLFLCTPNNPTGNSFNTNRIEQLLSNFDGLVVIDEAYIDFSTTESWLQRLDEFPNLIVTQTLSKAYGMAGIRLGICYASKAIVSILNKIKPPYNVNELTQQKALERLSLPELVSEEIKEILEQRRWLKAELSQMEWITMIYGSQSNFLLVKVDDANARYDQLIDHGIVVRNRTTQPLCENCLRFTVGTKKENLKLITTLKKIS